jgi:hypothetical protein
MSDEITVKEELSNIPEGQQVSWKAKKETVGRYWKRFEENGYKRLQKYS